MEKKIIDINLAQFLQYSPPGNYLWNMNEDMPSDMNFGNTKKILDRLMFWSGVSRVQQDLCAMFPLT